MKEALVSNCERAFILKAISEDRRLDGRRLKDYRKLEILYGIDYGSCQVSLGETRVLAQVSCEIQQPKATRPNEGMLHINIGLSPMGAPHFEAGRQSDTSIQLNRLLEKCIKDSKCIDLESLCIVAEEKVWNIRVDLNILNHEGNLVDCASVAALAAISHFRRPDVELIADEMVIYEPSVREPIPLSVRHYPVCVSFAIFNGGSKTAVDPSNLEEQVAEGQLTLGVNGYRELCGVHLTGSTQSGPDVVRRCGNAAANRAIEVVKHIKEAIAKDSEARSINKSVGFVESVKQGRITSYGVIPIKLPNHKGRSTLKATPVEKMETNIEEKIEEEVILVEIGDKGTALLGTPSKLKPKKEETTSDESESDSIQLVQEVEVEKKKMVAVVDDIVLSGDSEEEATVILHLNQQSQKSGKKAYKNRHKKRKH